MKRNIYLANNRRILTRYHKLSYKFHSYSAVLNANLLRGRIYDYAIDAFSRLCAFYMEKLRCDLYSMSEAIIQ